MGWAPRAVREIELADGMRDIEGLENYESAYVLFRYRGRPLAWRRLEVAEAKIPAPRVWSAAAAADVELHYRVLTDLLIGNHEDKKERLAPASIIVCTRNRPDDLERCIRSALSSLGPEVEMIVVDNCPSDDGTQALTSRFPVRYVREGRKGLNWARARGARAARHELLLYTDDDVVLDRNWATAMRRPFRDATTGGVSGLVLPYELEHEGQELFEEYCGFSRGFDRRIYSAAVLRATAAGVAGAGASMAVRRRLALDLGLFDIELDAGTATQSGGDTYAFYRLLRSGYEVAYEPSALAWHRHRRTREEVAQTLYGYSVGVYSFWLTCLLRHKDLDAIPIAVKWFVIHYLPLIWRGLRRLAPKDLVHAEVRGVWDAPFAYWRSRLSERNYVRDAQRSTS